MVLRRPRNKEYSVQKKACFREITYVGGSSKIQTFMSHDSSFIEIEVYSDGKTHRLLSSSTNVQVNK